MPRMFTVRGDRLGYSNSIIILGVLAIILIILFEGMTENLIPLYAVGVFIPFTLAQFGMVLKWLRERPERWGIKLTINLIGWYDYVYRIHDFTYYQTESSMANSFFFTFCCIYFY